MFSVKPSVLKSIQAGFQANHEDYRVGQTVPFVKSLVLQKQLQLTRIKQPRAF